MSSLSFPDINVWLALASPEHVHAAAARRWWEEEPGRIAFSRLTQLGLRRLMTTAAAMGRQTFEYDGGVARSRLVVTFDRALAERGARRLLPE